MNDTLLQSTLRELRTMLSRPRLWLVFALVVALFVLTGPFGTYERLGFPTRLGYWLVLHAATWACALASIALFDAALSRHIPSLLTRMLIGAAFSALPIGLAISVVNFALLMRPLNVWVFVENALTALPISLAISLLSWLSLSAAGPSDASRETDADEAAGAAAVTGASPSPAISTQATPDRSDPLERPGPLDRPALLDRLPVEKRGALIRLEVQDHYVLVVTTRGADLLLMRLGDAIAETGGETGQKIHRSHWVSDAGVKSVIREGGRNPRLVVETTDGRSLPVSRSQMPQVRIRWGGRISGS